ncbi:hypothetical protein BKA93DRAFT_878954 [Sparassis latifolia]
MRSRTSPPAMPPPATVPSHCSATCHLGRAHASHTYRHQLPCWSFTQPLLSRSFGLTTIVGERVSQLACKIKRTSKQCTRHWKESKNLEPDHHYGVTFYGDVYARLALTVKRAPGLDAEFMLSHGSLLHWHTNLCALEKRINQELPHASQADAQDAHVISRRKQVSRPGVSLTRWTKTSSAKPVHVMAMEKPMTIPAGKLQ